MASTPPERETGQARLDVPQRLTAPSGWRAMWSAAAMTPLWIVRGAGPAVRFGGVTGSQSGVVAAALHGSPSHAAGSSPQCAPFVPISTHESVLGPNFPAAVLRFRRLGARVERKRDCSRSTLLVGDQVHQRTGRPADLVVGAFRDPSALPPRRYTMRPSFLLRTSMSPPPKGPGS